MKSKLALFITISLALYGSALFGQGSIHIIGAAGLNMGDFTVNASSRQSKSFIKGSPYYNKDFMFGELKLQDGNKINGLFRYNIYGQELELIVKKDTLIITDPTKIKSLEFGGKSFVYSLILEDKKKNDLISGAYFEILNHGECKLLVKREINLKENKFVAHYGGGGGDGSQRYIPEQTYYIKISDDRPALKIKKSKSSLIKILSDHKSELEKYISDNKLKLSDNKDLAKVIEYFNTLRKS